MKYYRNSQYDKVKKLWKKIKRAGDVSKSISPKARLILSNALYQIEKHGEAILTHEELTEITETQNDQNCNLVKQIKHIVNVDFFRSLIRNDKKYRDGYIFTKNKNTDEILENPEEYFANLDTKNEKTSPNLIGDIAESNRLSSEPLHIYTKNKDKNDNHDYQHNQFLNSKNIDSENVETKEAKIATSEIVENSESWLAKEECQAIPEAKKQAAEFVEKPESLKGTQDITSYYQKPKTVEAKGKNGKMYNALPLEHLRLEEGILQASISKSNKPNYATSRVKVIIRNILEKKPETLIFGGRKGAINYLVKAIDGERDYEYEYKYPPTQEEKALSMAEISNMKRIQLEKELVKNEIKWF